MQPLPGGAVEERRLKAVVSASYGARIGRIDASMAGSSSREERETVGTDNN